MIADYFMLAFRSLTKRKLRSWLTMIGIFIGIAAVVALVSLGQGMREAIVGQFGSLGSDKLTVQAGGLGFGPPGSMVVDKLTTKDADVIRKVNGVEIVAERLIRAAPVEFNGVQRYSFATNIPQDDSRRLVLDVMSESMSLEPEYGRMLARNDRYKVVVGSDYIEKDLFSRTVKLGDRIKIGSKEFEVVGILKKSAGLFGNDLLIMNDEPMREALGIDDDVDLIAAQVANINELNLVAERIEKDLRKHRGVEMGKEDFSVQTPQQAIETLEQILNYVTWFLVFIAMISLVVGGIGIMNTMFTSVLERRKEIGIMKSIGARNSDIMTLFLIESGVLGLVGGIIGVALGVGLSKMVEVIATLQFGESLIQVQYTLLWIVFPLVFSFVIGSISGVLPALQAAKLKPVDALRK